MQRGKEKLGDDLKPEPNTNNVQFFAEANPLETTAEFRESTACVAADEPSVNVPRPSSKGLAGHAPLPVHRPVLLRVLGEIIQKRLGSERADSFEEELPHQILGAALTNQLL